MQKQGKGKNKKCNAKMDGNHVDTNSSVGVLPVESVAGKHEKCTQMDRNNGETNGNVGAFAVEVPPINIPPRACLSPVPLSHHKQNASQPESIETSTHSDSADPALFPSRQSTQQQPLSSSSQVITKNQTNNQSSTSIQQQPSSSFHAPLNKSNNQNGNGIPRTNVRRKGRFNIVVPSEDASPIVSVAPSVAPPRAGRVPSSAGTAVVKQTVAASAPLSPKNGSKQGKFIVSAVSSSAEEPMRGTMSTSPPPPPQISSEVKPAITKELSSLHLSKSTSNGSSSTVGKFTVTVAPVTTSLALSDEKQYQQVPLDPPATSRIFSKDTATIPGNGVPKGKFIVSAVPSSLPTDDKPPMVASTVAATITGCGATVPASKGKFIVSGSVTSSNGSPLVLSDEQHQQHRIADQPPKRGGSNGSSSVGKFTVSAVPTTVTPPSSDEHQHQQVLMEPPTTSRSVPKETVSSHGAGLPKGKFIVSAVSASIPSDDSRQERPPAVITTRTSTMTGCSTSDDQNQQQQVVEQQSVRDAAIPRNISNESFVSKGKFIVTAAATPATTSATTVEEQSVATASSAGRPRTLSIVESIASNNGSTTTKGKFIVSAATPNTVTTTSEDQQHQTSNTLPPSRIRTPPPSRTSPPPPNNVTNGIAKGKFIVSAVSNSVPTTADDRTQSSSHHQQSQSSLSTATTSAAAPRTNAKKKGRFVLIQAKIPSPSESAPDPVTGGVTGAVAILPTKEAIVAEVPTACSSTPLVITSTPYHHPSQASADQPIVTHPTTSSTPLVITHHTTTNDETTSAPTASAVIHSQSISRHFIQMPQPVIDGNCDHGATTSTSSKHTEEGSCGLENIFYYLEQMKMEAINAAEKIRTLENELKCLRHQNKELTQRNTELETNHSHEKNLRETANLKYKTLKKKFKDHKEQEAAKAAIARKNSAKVTTDTISNGGSGDDESLTSVGGLSSPAAETNSLCSPAIEYPSTTPTVTQALPVAADSSSFPRLPLTPQVAVSTGNNSTSISGSCANLIDSQASQKQMTTPRDRCLATEAMQVTLDSIKEGVRDEQQPKAMAKQIDDAGKTTGSNSSLATLQAIQESGDCEISSSTTINTTPTAASSDTSSPPTCQMEQQQLRPVRNRSYTEHNRVPPPMATNGTHQRSRSFTIPTSTNATDNATLQQSSSPRTTTTITHAYFDPLHNSSQESPDDTPREKSASKDDLLTLISYPAPTQDTSPEVGISSATSAALPTALMMMNNLALQTGSGQTTATIMQGTWHHGEQIIIPRHPHHQGMVTTTMGGGACTEGFHHHPMTMPMTQQMSQQYIFPQMIPQNEQQHITAVDFQHPHHMPQMQHSMVPPIVNQLHQQQVTAVPLGVNIGGGAADSIISQQRKSADPFDEIANRANNGAMWN